MLSPRLALIFLLVFVGSFAVTTAQEPDQDQDTLFQVSTLGALSDGIYDGEVTYAELEAHGDFGLGTFTAVNGEMVAFDGEFYQVRSDGVAYPVEDDLTTPFAAVTYFEADTTLDISEAMDCPTLFETIHAALPSENLYYAIKVTGQFSTLKTRSVEPQEPPYLPLAEVLQNQIVFEFNNIEATLAGWWLPAYLDGLNAVGFHFHALTGDKLAGGHMLDCTVQHVTVEIDTTHNWEVRLPVGDAFLNANLTE